MQSLRDRYLEVVDNSRTSQKAADCDLSVFGSGTQGISNYLEYVSKMLNPVINQEIIRLSRINTPSKNAFSLAQKFNSYDFSVLTSERSYIVFDRPPSNETIAAIRESSSYNLLIDKCSDPNVDMKVNLEIKQVRLPTYDGRLKTEFRAYIRIEPDQPFSETQEPRLYTLPDSLKQTQSAALC